MGDGNNNLALEMRNSIDYSTAMAGPIHGWPF